MKPKYNIYYYFPIPRSDGSGSTGIDYKNCEILSIEGNISTFKYSNKIFKISGNFVCEEIQNIK